MANPFDPTAPLPGPPDHWASTEMPSRRDGPPYHMTEMILAEPHLARRVLARLADPAGSAARLAMAVRASAAAGRPILVTGCGTSEHGAVAFAEILRAALRDLGLPSGPGEGGAPIAVQAFEAELDGALGGASALGDSGGLVIGISHEGATPATNRALEAARASGATTALVTVSGRSPGAALAEIVIETGELDQSWCHTIGYLSPILAAVAVAAHLAEPPLDPELVASLLAAGLGPDAVAAAESIASGIGRADRLIVAASGADRAAGRELVLKIEEGTWLPAAYRDLETMLHGHLAGTDERTALVVVLAEPNARDARVARVRGVLAAAGEIGMAAGAILAAGASAMVPTHLTPLGRVIVPEAPATTGADAALSGAAAALLATAIPLQLLTERLARARGINPDPIRRNVDRYLRAADAADAAD